MMRRVRAIMVLILIVGILLYSTVNFRTGEGKSYDLVPFSSYEELLRYIENSTGEGYYGEIVKGLGSETVIATSDGMEGGAESDRDYSTTNVQVEGVDEMDVVKTDGEYIYLAQNDMVYIIRTYPWQSAGIASIIHLNYSVKGLFLDDDRLVVMGVSYSCPPFRTYSFWFPGRAVVEVYNVTSKENPKRVCRMELEGTLFDARMVKGYVYIITTEPPYVLIKEENGTKDIIAPSIRISGCEKKIPPERIYHPPEMGGDCIMTYVTAVNVSRGEISDSMGVVMGLATTMYASANNLYLACIEQGVYYILEAGANNIKYHEDRERTIIYRIAMEGGKVKYSAYGEVPGKVLNQFSMDEYDGFFRVATTVGDAWSGNSSSGVYILNMDMEVVGHIDNIAPGERIYAVRFCGERGYVVTYRNTDPFFVLNLSDPYNPEIAGELKLPGFSTHLHPYDETHIVGIGRETETISGDSTTASPFERVTGIKISMFDVSDPENPVEISREVIEGEYVISPALWDHKALLFDREKHMLIIPVKIEHFFVMSEGDKEELHAGISFNGVYVYSIHSNGIIYNGRIEQNGSWSIVKRILYIDSVLYTISNEKIKMSDLQSLQPLGEINLDVYSIEQGASNEFIKVYHQS